MRRRELDEGVVVIKGSLIARADRAAKGWCASEGTTERPSRIRQLARGPERVEINGRAVEPIECRLLDQFAVVPGEAAIKR